jgi:hypothetical protein
MVPLAMLLETLDATLLDATLDATLLDATLEATLLEATLDATLLEATLEATLLDATDDDEPLLAAGLYEHQADVLGAPGKLVSEHAKLPVKVA